jgi:hypothetical protein
MSHFLHEQPSQFATSSSKTTGYFITFMYAVIVDMNSTAICSIACDFREELLYVSSFYDADSQRVAYSCYKCMLPSVASWSGG